ncbi:hypothetical protein M0R45_003610 [Rubus argutus]|uniref:Uncharacterized protein n=1 Tax=Rubus argutus TaxID=59490 RepID=A0AAW1YHP6_RUBAR
MATSNKFELSSGSPDRPLYTSGQRGSHMAASLERPGSFREGMENPILSSLPNMSRSTTAIAQGDVTNFLQYLRFDPNSSVKGKLLPAPIPEDIKRVRSGLRDSCVKARERVKIFNEALSVFNKVFPSVPSKKRSRQEISNERSSVVPMLGPNMGKIGIQSHSVAGGFELEQQKSEERTKNSVPNKRTRTSLVDVRMDVRSNTLVRPSGAVDRDREMLRLASGGAVQGEERNLSIGVDGWEKSKMKKKRSGIKPDVSPMVTSKPVDGCREIKQGMQQKPVNDVRSRLNNDSHGFRPGVANGAIGIGKSDGISQPTGPAFRSSIPKTEPDNPSLINDKRDRPIGSDKERVNHRAVNKANVRDDFNSASPTSSTKMNASVRAPRSGSTVTPKLSPVVHRATVPNDWEISQCTNKPPVVVGANNRKRNDIGTIFIPTSMGWPETTEKLSHCETIKFCSYCFKRLPGSSPQQVKLKGEALSSAALSESEESGVAEVKSRDKGKKSDEIDEKAGQNVQIQKVSSLVLPSRKNKLAAGEELGDGVRRQGRTGRGFASTRSLVPMTVEKMGNVGTAKQLRSSRLGVDKSEARQVVHQLGDFLIESPIHVKSIQQLIQQQIFSLSSILLVPSPAHFGRKWNNILVFLSDADIDYLKQQGNIDSSVTTPAEVPSSLDGSLTVHNGLRLSEFEPRSGEFHPELLVPGTGNHTEIPLCQRLIAALISEEDSSSGNEDPMFDAYGIESDLDAEVESNGLNYQSQVNFQFAGNAASNGYRITGRPDHDELEVGIRIPNRTISNFGHSQNGLLPDQAFLSGLACSEFQYGNMHINEKLLLEIQSIGIYPEPLPDMAQTGDDEISGEIRKLEEKYHEQVSNKKGLLDGLFRSVSEKKERQAKDLEQRALDKLVGMAYEKYLTCWGPNATGGKSSSNKMAKQAALAFVKRTLDRCHKYEETGTSCFSETVYRDILLSGASDVNGTQQAEVIADGESTQSYASARCLEASMGSKQSHSQFSQNMDNNVTSSDVLLPLNHLTEQTTGREETWANRVKKRELSLDDVGSTILTSNAPGIGNSLSSSAKGKRSERDRDGKGHNREVLSRNGTAKIGRPAVSNVKGERKSKTKPKQKTTQLSVSVNGPVGKISEQPKPTLPSVPKSGEMTTSRNAKQKDQFALDAMDDPESIDLSHLQLPGMDVLGVPDDIDDQGQDLGSWLNIDDDGLQDHDFMGLEIPMDDLSDLNMMV